MSSIKEFLPWYAKIIAKIVLSRMPISYKIWQSMDLFKHGQMENAQTALKIFKSHYNAFAQSNLSCANFSMLELGPGDSIASAIIAFAFGAKQSFLVDVGRFAKEQTKIYIDLVNLLHSSGLPTPKIGEGDSLASILHSCNAQYLTEGLTSLRAISTASVNFVWSNAVLEHISRHEFTSTIAELYRISSNDSLSSHQVDLRDHLGGQLNNLRFSHDLWESKFMSSSGFYTNRIRYQEMLAIFQQAGFKIKQLNPARWAQVPTPRSHLAPPFRDLPDDDICVSGFRVVLSPS